MRQNWLSNRVFDTYDNIAEAIVDGWSEHLRPMSIEAFL